MQTLLLLTIAGTMGAAALAVGLAAPLAGQAMLAGACIVAGAGLARLVI